VTAVPLALHRPPLNCLQYIITCSGGSSSVVVGVVGGNLPVVVHGGGIGEEDADISGGIPGDSGATCPIKLPTIYNNIFSKY